MKKALDIPHKALVGICEPFSFPDWANEDVHNEAGTQGAESRMLMPDVLHFLAESDLSFIQ